jgi:hypothetical protein
MTKPFVISRVFDAPRDGMTQSWTGTMEQLIDYLKSIAEK